LLFYAAVAFAFARRRGWRGGRAAQHVRPAYLLKERIAQPGQLAEAIGTVATGGSVIDPRIVESMLSAQTRRHRIPPREPRTARRRGRCRWASADCGRSRRRVPLVL